MVFIDDLAYSLFSISFAGFLLFYTVVSIYKSYKRKGKDFTEHLNGASIPLALIGAYIFIMGLWGQFSWPLPGSYNILFYDPFVAFGIVLLSFSFVIRFKGRIDYAGFLGLMSGIMAIIYGVEGYGLGLTQAPLALLVMYFLYGIAGIFSYPVSLLLDRFPGTQKKFWKGWYYILVIFLASLFLASLLAGFIGAAAIPSHLFSAP